MSLEFKHFARKLGVVFFLIAIPCSGFTQPREVERIKRLKIEIMPEFDREGILVIYKGELLPDTVLPAKVSISLSSDIHLNAVAFKSKEKNKLLMGSYEARTKDGYTILDITATSDNFWIELYTSKNSIKKDGNTRKFSYSWKGNIAVDEINWSVQQPVNGTGLKVEPGGGVMTRDDYGLPAYKYSTLNHPGNTPATLNVTYQKSDNVLTSSIIKSAEPDQEPDQTFPAQQQFKETSKNTDNSTPLFLAIIGALVVGLGIIIIAKKSK